MRGFQAAGAAAIVRGCTIADPKTIASALEIGDPENWSKAITARDESEGSIEDVTDTQILAAYRELALEGVFCEPASGAAVAGLLDRAARGLVAQGSSVVCILTGSGLKDPDRALSESQEVIICDADNISSALGW
jgi:threonine synthase